MKPTDIVMGLSRYYRDVEKLGRISKEKRVQIMLGVVAACTAMRDNRIPVLELPTETTSKE